VAAHEGASVNLRAALEPEVIVVQSRGMERWLSMQLAHAQGVWANARFPFPRAFVDEVLTGVLDPERASGVSAEDASLAWSRERLVWAIASVLDSDADDVELAVPRAYVGAQRDPSRLVELSQRIADLFDQYSVFRPELVLSWEAGAEQDWQAALWRRLVKRLGSFHLAARAKALFELQPERPGAPWVLPRRVCVFGISSLPPIYVRILGWLARRVPLHLFQLAPSREYLGEQKTVKELMRESSPPGAGAPDCPLLASLGRVARDFQSVLLEEPEVHEDDRFADPGEGSLLQVLQSDILHLRRRGKAGEPVFQRAPDDVSVQIHSCHSPMREVEVLRDQLREALEVDPSLTPEDIIVMTPDIDAYAPFIEAAFGLEGEARIPYRVADRQRRTVSPIARAFEALSRAFRERVTASSVLDLLAHEPIRRRFGVLEAELTEITRFIREANIRWGIDREDRRREAQPALEENTWEFGLRRLLLGHAMPGGGRELFLNVLPFDDIEGAGAEPLGKLIEACRAFFHWRASLADPRSLPEWRAALVELTGELLSPTDAEALELQRLRELAGELASAAAAAEFTRGLPAELVFRLMLEALAGERTSHDFLSGGVTFCALLPMRSIPFRVVALLGMNDAAFPRNQPVPSFDRMAAEPRPGDRSLREEDRYLFLEALLSARERLILTYVGRSVADDSVEPPSVVVSELLDTLERSSTVAAPVSSQQVLGFAGAPRATVLETTVQHPLQPWSLRYFSESRQEWCGYDEQAARGAAALAARKRRPAPFLRAPLAPEPRRPLSLEELARFLANPARELLRYRLELRLEDKASVVEDREPFELDALDDYKVGSALLERRVRGENPAQAAACLRAEGVLPLGALGERRLSALRPAVERLVENATSYLEGPRRRTEFDQVIGGQRLAGDLSGLHGEARVVVGYGRLKPKRELEAWVTHLALQLTEGAPRHTVLIGRDPNESNRDAVAVRRFLPMPAADAAALLEDMAHLYELGRRVPMPFFPEAARSLVALCRRAGESFDFGQALEEAAERYLPTDYDRSRGEGQNVYVAKLFGALDPLEPEFAYFPGIQPSVPDFPTLAERIMGPLIDHLAASDVPDVSAEEGS
jgi:exodeoxyribonuclease V gamma subunit